MVEMLFLWDSNSKSRGDLPDSWLLLEPFPSYLVAMTNLAMRFYAQSYCNLLFHIWLITLRGLLFYLFTFLRETEGVHIGERGRGVEWDRVEGRNHSWDVTHVRRINNNKSTFWLAGCGMALKFYDAA